MKYFIEGASPKRKLWRSGICWGMGILLLLPIACSGPKKNAEKQRVVTVTTEPQRYITEAVAGDKFTVVCMVPKGSSPETYDPIPRQLMALSESEAYLRIGYIGFELSWMDRLIKNAPHIQVFDTSKDVELIHETGYAHGEHFHEGGIEPHIWCSAVNMKIIARNTFHALRALDKENESYYSARYDSLSRRIDQTDSIIRDILKEGADHAFMIYHPSLSYYARDYNLHQISIEEDGKEPSPGRYKKLIEVCKAENVRVVFIQPEFDQRNAKVIAQETGTTVIPIHPLSYDWEAEMIGVAKALKK